MGDANEPRARISIKSTSMKRQANSTSLWALDELSKWNRNVTPGVIASASCLQTGGHSRGWSRMESALTRDDLCPERLQVIGQVDAKFIACILRYVMIYLLISSGSSYSRLIIADQHAVDERIRLERILRELCNTVTLDPPIHLSFTRQEQDQVYRKIDRLATWGLNLEIDGTGFIINSVPTPVKTRFIQQPQLLKSVILSIVNGVDGGIVPVALMDVCKSVACRGAVMFGTGLGRDECVGLMLGVSACQYPFICAHGRPGIVPIAEF
jgi:DNA mismatch repair protein MLH3